jgi:PadR family transcriptional regulator, regulatory protein PadR
MDGTDFIQEDLDRAIDKWRGQSRKGFLELCILLSVQLNERIFGYAIMENLQSLGLDMSEGSLYPLLARLVKEKTLEACWEMPAEGHPRKYYTLSPFGLEFLHQIEQAYRADHRAFLNLKDERSEP